MGTTDRLDSLTDIEAAVWRELAAAPGDARHGWHVPVLATASGPEPEARTVVLREADAEARRLVVYSDARAGKVAQLRAQPRGVLVFWCARLGWQLRLNATFEVETDGIAVTSRWARIKLSPNARDYLSPLAPGGPLVPGRAPPEPCERVNFAVLEAEVQAVDWLELHRAGHRRARFDANGPRWLQP
jgi:hypothetical protein